MNTVRDIQEIVSGIEMLQTEIHVQKFGLCNVKKSEIEKVTRSIQDKKSSKNTASSGYLRD